MTALMANEIYMSFTLMEGKFSKFREFDKTVNHELGSI